MLRRGKDESQEAKELTLRKRSVEELVSAAREEVESLKTEKQAVLNELGSIGQTKTELTRSIEALKVEEQERKDELIQLEADFEKKKKDKQQEYAAAVPELEKAKATMVRNDFHLKNQNEALSVLNSNVREAEAMFKEITAENVAKIEEAKRELDRLENNAAILNADINKRETTIKNLNDDIATLNAAKQTKEAVISSLEKKLDELSRSRLDKMKELSDVDYDMAQRKTELLELQSQITDKAQELESIDSDIKQARALAIKNAQERKVLDQYKQRLEEMYKDAGVPFEY